jgi:hypothetical protein
VRAYHTHSRRAARARVHKHTRTQTVITLSCARQSQRRNLETQGDVEQMRRELRKQNRIIEKLTRKVRLA